MISVIIPTHKRAGLLFYELEKIYQQKDVDIEVVVINDIEDEDETDKINILFPDVKYIKSEYFQGPSEKHKKGFAITTGEFVYMPDDDDYLTDDYFFSKSEKIFKKDNSISIVCGNVNIRYENDDSSPVQYRHQKLNISGKINGINYLQEFQHKYIKPASTVSTIFRRSALDENMIEMSDSSIYMQALLNGDAWFIDDIVAVYRIQQSKGKSLTSSASLNFIMNVIRQKEHIYMRAKSLLQRPKDFWSYHFEMSYMLLSQKQNCNSEKKRVLLWGLAHMHGSIRMFYYIIKQLVKLVLE